MHKVFKIKLEACLLAPKLRTQLSFRGEKGEARFEMCDMRIFLRGSLSVSRFHVATAAAAAALCHHKWYHYGAILRLNVCIIPPCLRKRVGTPRRSTIRKLHGSCKIFKTLRSVDVMVHNFPLSRLSFLRPRKIVPQRHFNFSQTKVFGFALYFCF